MLVGAPVQNKRFQKAADLGLISSIQDSSGTVIGELNHISLGLVEIVTVPGELFPSIWWEAKKEMRRGIKMVFGLTDGEFGYILPSRDFNGKHPYHESMSVGPKFGDEVEKGLLYLIKNTKAP